MELREGMLVIAGTIAAIAGVPQLPFPAQLSFSSGLWIGLGAGILGGIVSGIIVMYSNLILARPKLRLSTFNDAAASTSTRSVGVEVENYSFKLPFVERNVAKRISIIFRVSGAEQTLKNTWFTGTWGSSTHTDIGHQEKKYMIIATKKAGNGNCTLVSPDTLPALSPGRYYLDWTLYRGGNPVGEGKLLLSNDGNSLDSFSLVNANSD